jgi:neurotransmitter:Na+ symporter, NSS family
MSRAAGGAPEHAHWSSRAGFVLAAIGVAVGLGNLWRFSSEAGANGGGAFVLMYVLIVALIGTPILLSEVVIGRRGQGNAVHSALTMARDSQASPAWASFAWLGLAASFLTLTFYSVLAGWVLYYVGSLGFDLAGAVAGGAPFAGAYAGETIGAIEARLPSLLGDPLRMSLLHFVFMALTCYIVARGVRGGIEKLARFAMPTFFLLLLLLVAYGAVAGDMAAAAAFLFTPDFERAFQPQVVSAALGQVFFSLGLGNAGMITYGAYVGRETNLAKTSGIIAGADTGVALLAGLAIFPIVFAVGLDPAAGPTLMFQTLPAAFQGMPGGALVGFLFFSLAVFAALTSSVAMLEVVVAWTTERFGIARGLVSVTVAALAFLFGLFAVFAFNIMDDLRPLALIPGFENLNWFDAMNDFVGRLLLPVGGLVAVIFIGWVADRRIVDPETGLTGAMLPLWRFLIAWLCPLAVGVILVVSLFPGLFA